MVIRIIQTSRGVIIMVTIHIVIVMVLIIFIVIVIEVMTSIHRQAVGYS